jgi:hypothetical protein
MEVSISMGSLFIHGEIGKASRQKLLPYIIKAAKEQGVEIEL